MKSSEFDQWCRRLGLSRELRDFIARLRTSSPVRRVQGRAGNVSGAYASRKMGVTIQFESHTVELWAVYTMEYDADVLEYFDQPYTLALTYQGLSGKKVEAQHTPDFFVIRHNSAGFEEWKPEKRLLELAVSHPFRYQRDPGGGWRCPPGEEAAARLGVSYRVRSSASLQATYVRNLIFLEDYFFEHMLSQEMSSHILDYVFSTPGVSLATLLREEPHVSVDTVYALIARNQFYVDVYAEPLREHQRVHLYPDRATAEAHSLLLAHRASAPFGKPGGEKTQAALIPLHANVPVIWDGRQWTLLNLGNTTTTLLPEVGPPL